MKKTIISLLISIIILSASVEATISRTDQKTIEQVQQAKITDPGKFIGIILISDIKAATIKNITVATDTYNMNIGFVEESFLIIFKKIRVYQNFTDYMTNTNYLNSFTIGYYYTDSYIELPKHRLTASSDNFKIISDIWTYNLWEQGGRGVISLNSIQNYQDFNLTTPIISPTTATITVAGSDKVNITYYTGTAQEILDASTTEAGDEGEDWFEWIVLKIPFIGQFIYQSISFLTVFFSLSLTILGFLLLNPALLYLLFLSFSMLKGMMKLIRGDSLIEFIISISTDHAHFIKFIIYFVVGILGLMWRIVLAIATVVKSILPF